jgi:hypothetical protein
MENHNLKNIFMLASVLSGLTGSFLFLSFDKPV